MKKFILYKIQNNKKFDLITIKSDKTKEEIKEYFKSRNIVFDGVDSIPLTKQEAKLYV